jgi:DNA-binding ferritin-like protein
MSATVAEFIDRMFGERNASHLEHLRVTGPSSYARHVALNGFYDEVVDLTDRFMEAYQGNKGIVDTSGLSCCAHDTGMEEQLAENAAWLNENRNELSAGVGAISNIIDEIIELHLSTRYKLVNLH